MTRPTLLALFLLAAFLPGAAGCGFQESQPDPTGEGGTLRFISPDAVNTLDPQGTSWLSDFRMIEGIFEPLLRVNPETLAVEPAAAEALPTVSDDGKTYTFTLRDDLKWQNVDPVTSNDFAYAWQRALLADFAADYSGLFFCIEGAEDFFLWRAEQLANLKNSGKTASQLWDETKQRFRDTVGIETPDDRTLIVRLKQPTAYFNELAAFTPFAPVHEASVADTVEVNADTGVVTKDPGYWQDPERLIGNGPYRLSTNQPKVRMILDASPTYHGAAEVANARIVMEVDASPTGALLRYERGGVDWYPGFPTNDPKAAALVAADRDDVHYGPAAGTYYYLFNCLPEHEGRPNPLADPRVRRALSLAVDRSLIVQNVTRLNQPVARSFVPPGVLPGYDPPVEAGPTFDPDTARRLLAEAGYPDGRGLDNLSVLFNSEGEHGLVAQSIANMWREHLGVTVQLEQVEKKTFSQRRRSQGFTIARGGWFGDYRDPTTFLDMLRTNDGNNDPKYQNPDYDRLLAEAAETADTARRTELLQEAEALMLNDLPVMPIYHYTNLDLYDPETVKGLSLNPWNYRSLEAVAVEP